MLGDILQICSIKTNKTKPALDLFGVFGFWPIPDCFQMVFEWAPLTGTQLVSQNGDFTAKIVTLRKFDFEVMFFQTAKNFSEVCNVSGQKTGVSFAAGATYHVI